ncbi:hypothetical protein HanRHA438_Chr11g0524051 [Helianthus annuus]|nr:hypothetical protein HanIR_Chr11g0550321 [Helianthus annuus]KAJ0690824.1 hypothetical protein HanOQP8_Chr11g0422101 [Helianthus annuus]KAJ0872470.1 hypothetical protein HanRHA438_Chr11g0524051 [Helianthus annuus]
MTKYAIPHMVGDIYILDERRLNVLRGMQERYCIWEVVNEALQSKSSGQSFLVTCDQHLLVVLVDTFGESVEVFKLNGSTREWEKTDSLGKHILYVCHTRCFCIEARITEMENKIYFPLVHSENGKIVFYSLETRKYHTFSGRNVQESFGDFFGTKYHLNRHAWIKPSWS